MSYLTEEKLKYHLETIFNLEFIHNKQVPNSNIKNRPDYRNDSIMLIVEFDGYLHYTQPKTIIADFKKDEVYSKMGYKIVRIPYFVQLSKQVINFLFNKDLNFIQEYQHGFIDKKCVLPAEFCSLGIIRYKQDLQKFDFISNDIKKSLVNKIKFLNDKRLVLF